MSHVIQHIIFHTALSRNYVILIFRLLVVDVNRDLLPDEVSPYATSQIPGCKGDHGKLHVFHHRHFEPELLHTNVSLLCQ